MWFFLSLRKGATLSAKLQWTPHIVSRKWNVDINSLIYLTTRLGYVDDLLQKTIDMCEVGHRPLSTEVPDSLCSTYERPEKSLAISSHKSRFSLASYPGLSQFFQCCTQKNGKALSIL